MNIGSCLLSFGLPYSNLYKLIFLPSTYWLIIDFTYFQFMNSPSCLRFYETLRKLFIISLLKFLLIIKIIWILIVWALFIWKIFLGKEFNRIYLIFTVNLISYRLSFFQNEQYQIWIGAIFNWSYFEIHFYWFIDLVLFIWNLDFF